MISDWSIGLFGPIGVSSMPLEAPGSMCVITLPGLTGRPEAPAEDEAAEGPVYVVAASGTAFCDYMRSRGLPRADRLNHRYVNSAEVLAGATRGRVVLAGYYWRHWDWDGINRAVDVLRRLWGIEPSVEDL